MKRYITPFRFRFSIQLIFTLFCVYVGVRFAVFLAWAAGQSVGIVAKPGAVEGFLPISALLGFRNLVQTGEWDVIHPAGLTIFIAVMVMCFLFRKGFCGYVCPVGFVSNLLERAGRRLNLAVIPNKWIDYPLMSIKYVVFGFFLYTVLFGMDFRSVRSFLTSPYNMVADAKMLAFFTDPTALSLVILFSLALLSLVVRNFWCRYLCPYGALLGILAWFGPVAIKRNTITCIDCGQCTQVCPSGIRVQDKRIVRSPECLGCAECIDHCPVNDCLSFSAYRRFAVPWMAVGIGAVAVLLGFYAWGVMTGHWDSQMPTLMIRKMYGSL
ncbi:MAG: 4Fe-4S binding protein [Pseudodesulfovibrio sp.]|nr:4Fe-4S binding protein [Pseudodesulfovibrio sp.]